MANLDSLSSFLCSLLSSVTCNLKTGRGKTVRQFCCVAFTGAKILFCFVCWLLVESFCKPILLNVEDLSALGVLLFSYSGKNKMCKNWHWFYGYYGNGSTCNRYFVTNLLSVFVCCMSQVLILQDVYFCGCYSFYSISVHALHENIMGFEFIFMCMGVEFVWF